VELWEDICERSEECLGQLNTSFLDDSDDVEASESSEGVGEDEREEDADPLDSLIGIE
jgi:hypothetical protein